MSAVLAGHLQDYLRLRRALGFKLTFEGQVLPQFLAYLDAAGNETVTVEAAVAWTRLSVGAQPVTLSHRLGAVRGFARYLATIDPATQIPPCGLFGKQQRRMPYIYSAEEIGQLVQAAGRLCPPLRAATYQALFGLLAVSGMRIGEASRLLRADVDLTAGVIRIRHAKFDRHRLVPLHPSATEALRGYATQRDKMCAQPRTDTFFISSLGTALAHSSVHVTFLSLLAPAGLPTATGSRPRIHDLRHSLAARTTKSPSPDPGPGTRTTALTSSRRTGRGSANWSGTCATTRPPNSIYSTTSGSSTGCSRTTCCPSRS